MKRPLSIAARAHVANEQRRLIEWLLIDVWRNSGVVIWMEPFVLLTQSDKSNVPVWNLHMSE